MNLKCIIFDLDGTLVDSEQLGSRALIELLPEINESLEVLTDRYHGGKLAEILIDIESRFQCLIPKDFEVVYRRRLARIFEQALQPIPGAIEVLAQLEPPLVDRICIASNGPLAKIKDALRITGLADYFATNLYSAYEIGAWKPAPDLFLYAACQMGVGVDECIVVEDSPAGVEASKAAGITVLHFSSKPVEANSKTYRAFSDLRELPKLLMKLQQMDSPNISS
ncbi:MAG: HAD-IA family hydrolase [Pseudomonadales bacterium]|nr:HAD-IA family hydrolase [Pseudomonadales bacterium]